MNQNLDQKLIAVALSGSIPASKDEFDTYLEMAKESAIAQLNDLKIDGISYDFSAEDGKRFQVDGKGHSNLKDAMIAQLSNGDKNE